jgi:hypothetical protein
LVALASENDETTKQVQARDKRLQQQQLDGELSVVTGK